VLLFSNRFVGAVIGKVSADVLALIVAVFGFILALLCLVAVRRLGRRGILGHAIAGLILNGLITSLWLSNFLTATSRGH